MLWATSIHPLGTSCSDEAMLPLVPGRCTFLPPMEANGRSHSLLLRPDGFCWTWPALSPMALATAPWSRSQLHWDPAPLQTVANDRSSLAAPSCSVRTHPRTRSVLPEPQCCAPGPARITTISSRMDGGSKRMWTGLLAFIVCGAVAGVKKRNTAHAQPPHVLGPAVGNTET